MKQKTNNQLNKRRVTMSKNTYSIINTTNNEVIATQTSFPPCRDICRDFLYKPENFGIRLQVVKNRQEDGSGEVVFDVTNIKYSSGRVRMTLWTEYQRQQKMHAETARKAAERAAAKEAAPATEQVAEEPKAEEPKKVAAKKSAKKAK